MREQWNPLRLTAGDRFPAPLAAVLLLVFAAGTLYVGLHHEPWRDEADAWLVARDLPLIDMVPGWTAHAGTPVLWYLVLKTLIAFRLPYVAETIVNLLFIWAAAAVLLFEAPLTRLTKILFLASYFMAYEYAVIARSYALAILLIFLAAALWRSRDASPLRFAIVVALLFNTNLHAAIFAALLTLIFVIGRPHERRQIAGVAVMVAGAVVAYLQLRLPAGQSNPAAMRALRLDALITALRDAFLPASLSTWTALAGLIVIVAVAVAIRRSREALLLLAGAVAALLILYTAVWFGGLRASGMILIALITSIWIASNVPVATGSRFAAIALNVTLVFSAAFSFMMARNDVAYAFSGSKEMAQFIDRRFDGYDIAAHGFYQAEALLPYLPQRKFWYVALGEYGTFLKWDDTLRRGSAMPYETVVRAAQQHFARSNRPWLLLLNRKMPQPERWGFRLIHATSVVVFRNLDERYWLYEPAIPFSNFQYQTDMRLDANEGPTTSTVRTTSCSADRCACRIRAV